MVNISSDFLRQWAALLSIAYSLVYIQLYESNHKHLRYNIKPNPNNILLHTHSH